MNPKKLRQSVFAAIASLVLFGCGEPGSSVEPVNSVEFYKQNKPDRLAMLRKCNDYPHDKFKNDKNCNNATRAWAERAAQ